MLNFIKFKWAFCPIKLLDQSAIICRRLGIATETATYYIRYRDYHNH